MGLEQDCLFFPVFFLFEEVVGWERGLVGMLACFVVNYNKPVYTYVQLYPGYHNIPGRQPGLGFSTFSKGYQWILSRLVSGTASSSSFLAENSP